MWSLRFPFPIHVDDLLTIRSLADARAFLLSLPADTQQLPRWRNIAELLITSANTENSTLIRVTAERLQDAPSTPEVASALPHQKPPARSVKRRATALARCSYDSANDAEEQPRGAHPSRNC
jgi:hypothetical protein